MGPDGSCEGDYSGISKSLSQRFYFVHVIASLLPAPWVAACPLADSASEVFTLILDCGENAEHDCVQQIPSPSNTVLSSNHAWKAKHTFRSDVVTTEWHGSPVYGTPQEASSLFPRGDWRIPSTQHLAHLPTRTFVHFFPLTAF